ncbi:MAG: hypothetical protein U1G05_14775 [Kiritimatiellia bacterium]
MNPSVPGKPGRRALSERTHAVVFFIVVALALLLSDKGQIEGDGIVRWKTLDTLMSEGRLNADRYTVVQPLLAAPLYLAGDLQARAAGATPEARTKILRHWVRRFNKVVAFGVAAWFFTFLRKRAGWRSNEAAWGTLFLLFGTMLIPHARDFYSECLWTLFCLAGLGLYCRLDGEAPGRERWRTVARFVLCCVWIVPLNPLLLFVGGGLIALNFLWRIVAGRMPVAAALRRSDAWVAGLTLLLGAGLCALENLARRGSLSNFGYSGEGFTTPFLHGLAGQLVAPARGMVFFMPCFFCGLILLTRRGDGLNGPARRLVAASLLFSAGLVAAYARWHAWHGAWYWGPRFLLLPSILGALYFVLLARETWNRCGGAARAGLAVLGLASYMVYKAGVGVGQRHLLECLRQGPRGTNATGGGSSSQASWCNGPDLAAMFADRSTLVEIVTVVLVAVLARFAPAAGAEAPRG